MNKDNKNNDFNDLLQQKICHSDSCTRGVCGWGFNQLDCREISTLNKHFRPINDENMLKNEFKLNFVYNITFYCCSYIFLFKNKLKTPLYALLQWITFLRVHGSNLCQDGDKSLQPIRLTRCDSWGERSKKQLYMLLTIQP